MILRLLLLVLLSAVAFAAGGQTPGVEFRALAWQGTISDVSYDVLKPRRKLQLSDARMTDWHTLTPSSTGMVEFFQLPEKDPVKPVVAGTAEAKPKPLVLAQVMWPKDLKRAILLFVATPGGLPTPYTVVIIAERDSTAPAAAWRLCNYSSAVIAAQIGDEPPAQLKSGSIREGENRPKNGEDQSIKLAYQSNKSWELFGDDYISMPKEFVTYIFVRNLPLVEDDPDAPRVGYKLLYDRIP